MIRYISIISVVFLLTFGFSRCSILDIDLPDNLTQDEYWKSREQLVANLMGTYTQVNSSVVTFLTWGDVRSGLYTSGLDMLDVDKQLIAQDIFPTNTRANWSAIYTGINRANSFIQNAPLVLANDPSVTEEEVAALQAEAYTIRAMYYFYLVRTFKEVPVSLVAYESDLQDAPAKVETEAEILKVIEADLALAYDTATEGFSTGAQEQYGRVTKNAVRALWADVKLWSKDYAGAIELCSELDTEYDGKLLRGRSWYNNFSLGNTSESIFEYQYLSIGLSSPFFKLFRATSDGHYLINMPSYYGSVATLFPSESEDFLYSDTIRVLASTSFGDEVYKFTGSTPYSETALDYRSAEAQRTINFIFYRYAEIVLIKAEALAMLGRYDEAEAAVNKLRTAREVPLIETGAFETGTRFLESLLNERVAELAFEGKQWFSMVRMARNSDDSEAAMTLLIDRIALGQEGVKIQTMRARLLDPESWFMPYLTSEVDASNGDLKQKPYYEGK